MAKKTFLLLCLAGLLPLSLCSASTPCEEGDETCRAVLDEAQGNLEGDLSLRQLRGELLEEEAGHDQKVADSATSADERNLLSPRSAEEEEEEEPPGSDVSELEVGSSR